MDLSSFDGCFSGIYLPMSVMVVILMGLVLFFLTSFSAHSFGLLIRIFGACRNW